MIYFVPVAVILVLSPPRELNQDLCQQAYYSRYLHQFKAVQDRSYFFRVRRVPTRLSNSIFYQYQVKDKTSDSPVSNSLSVHLRVFFFLWQRNPQPQKKNLKIKYSLKVKPSPPAVILASTHSKYLCIN